jgi:curved DNA-binding protein
VGAPRESDPYAVLGVRRGASFEEIRAAFRAKARAFHPDSRPDDPTAADTFRRIRDAYQVLRAAMPRAAHRPPPRAAPSSPPPGSEARDALDGTVTRKRNEARYGKTPFHRPRDGSSVSGSLWVPFAAAIRGGDHTLDIDEPAIGSRRRRVTLPAGVETGQLFRIEGRVVRAEVMPHAALTRDGHHVLLALPLGLGELLLGATVRVPTVDGPADLVVPPNSRAGQRLRLAGKGVAPDGDQLCMLALAWPDVAAPGVEAAVRALAEAQGPAPRSWDEAPRGDADDTSSE